MPNISELAFEIPSKTFIIGEYLAINGTASMVMATEPSFFIKTIEDDNFGFHVDSPAGRRRKALNQKGFGFSVFDPHEGRGGFGRSTAEYLAVEMYSRLKETTPETISADILENLEDFIADYRASCGRDYKPSGADLVAQVCGGICWYDGMNYIADRLVWPFPGYDLLVFHTGKKLATHEHLQDLPKIDFKSLMPILLAARTAFDQENLKVFAESLNYYYDLLDEMKLSEQRVRKSVTRLRQSPLVLAAKGCGAMGVDTVIVLCEKSNADQVKELCFAEDFQYITSQSQVHSGAVVRRPL